MGVGKKYWSRKQQGISLTSIIFVLIVLGSLLVLGLRITPVVVEYQSIKNAIAKAKAAGGTPLEMRKEFDNNASVNDIDSIHGKDLEIVREADETQISFEYERTVPLFANASLVLKFSGSTDPHRTSPSKTAVAEK